MSQARLLKAIQDELEEIGVWADASKNVFGKRWLEEFKRRKEIARSAYKHIPPTDPSALTLLIEAQSSERICDSLIAMMENAEKRKKELDKELEYVKEGLVKQNKVSREKDIYKGETG